jgi:hypothetical protein
MSVAARPSPVCHPARAGAAGRMIVVALALLGLTLVARGIQHWRTQSAVTEVVTAFVQALFHGDRAGVLAQMSPEVRAAVAAGGRKDRTLIVPPQSAVQYDVRKMQIDGDRAVVRLRLEKQGARLEPVLHLAWSEAEGWKIVRIEQLDADPLRTKLESEHARAVDEALARQLDDALQDRPGIAVERTPLNASP